ncbi:MAG: NTP transferase domain-containing protein [Pseudomonadota bacterium]
MTLPPLFEHPQDVLHQWLDWDAQGGAALVVVAATKGGAIRAPGSLMAVSPAGETAGYVSGGCIDADVALNAVSAIRRGEEVRLRYGADSPFKDLPLPCGGTIDIAIFPNLDRRLIERCYADLSARRPARLFLDGANGPQQFDYHPKLRIRIAGRGADALALARVCRAAGFPTEVALPESDIQLMVQTPDEPDFTKLVTPTSLPDVHDDAWTAFVLMFHDVDWEVPLLRQALAGPAFYIGAVGSQRSHKTRCAALAAAGLHDRQIARVRGPVGLIRSLRDASMIAVSTLAEIVEAYHAASVADFANTGLVLLAAGQSSRFEEGDKLLADLEGEPVIAHSARALASTRVGQRVAVVGPYHRDRANQLSGAGWTVVQNPAPELGLSSSLSTAIIALDAVSHIDAALVLLADMPRVPDAHLNALRQEMTPGVDAVMSRIDGVLGPPALFSRRIFPELTQLTGDKGARILFESLSETRIIDLDPEFAQDIDRKADLVTVRTV